MLLKLKLLKIMKINILKNWLFIFPLLFLSCDTLDFYGDAFYSVKGRIIDENDQSIPDLNIKVYTSGNKFGFNLYSVADYGIVSGSGKTDGNGEFLITFPKSNGHNFLLLDEGYQIIDSINTGSYNPNLAKLEIDQFKDYLLDIKTVKITKP